MSGAADMIRPVYGVLPSPEFSPAILVHVKTGRVYDLSFPISARTPHATTTSPFSMTPRQRHDQRPHGEAFGEATEILTMSSHTLSTTKNVKTKATSSPLPGMLPPKW